MPVVTLEMILVDTWDRGRGEQRVADVQTQYTLSERVIDTVVIRNLFIWSFDAFSYTSDYDVSTDIIIEVINIFKISI